MSQSVGIINEQLPLVWTQGLTRNLGSVAEINRHDEVVRYGSVEAEYTLVYAHCCIHNLQSLTWHLMPCLSPFVLSFF